MWNIHNCYQICQKKYFLILLLQLCSQKSFHGNLHVFCIRTLTVLIIKNYFHRIFNSDELNFKDDVLNSGINGPYQLRLD